jgi:hypothetical protein
MLLNLLPVSSICFEIAQDKTPGIIFSDTTSSLFVLKELDWMMGTILANPTLQQISCIRVKN